MRTAPNVKVETLADMIRVRVCHCLACQRRSGSVSGAQARSARAWVTVPDDVTLMA